jgi:hypothetical protein
VTQARSKRRGQGEDSIYRDSSKNRYVGAASLGFSPTGTRIRRKVTGRTKAEVRGKLRELRQEVDRGLRLSRSYTGRRSLWGGGGSGGSRAAIIASAMKVL